MWHFCSPSVPSPGPRNLPNALGVPVGLLALYGFAGSIISGMLYKIMPFLTWFHLHAMSRAGRVLPNVKQILAESDQRRQFWGHGAALALLAGAVVWPGALVYPAAIALGAAAVLLEINLLKVVGVLNALARRGDTSASAAERAQS